MTTIRTVTRSYKLMPISSYVCRIQRIVILEALVLRVQSWRNTDEQSAFLRKEMKPENSNKMRITRMKTNVKVNRLPFLRGSGPPTRIWTLKPVVSSRPLAISVRTVSAFSIALSQYVSILNRTKENDLLLHLPSLATTFLLLQWQLIFSG